MLGGPGRQAKPHGGGGSWSHRLLGLLLALATLWSAAAVAVHTHESDLSHAAKCVVCHVAHQPVPDDGAAARAGPTPPTTLEPLQTQLVPPAEGIRLSTVRPRAPPA